MAVWDIYSWCVQWKFDVWLKKNRGKRSEVDLAWGGGKKNLERGKKVFQVIFMSSQFCPMQETPWGNLGSVCELWIYWLSQIVLYIMWCLNKFYARKECWIQKKNYWCCLMVVIGKRLERADYSYPEGFFSLRMISKVWNERTKWYLKTHICVKTTKSFVKAKVKSNRGATIIPSQHLSVFEHAQGWQSFILCRMILRMNRDNIVKHFSAILRLE